MTSTPHEDLIRGVGKLPLIHLMNVAIQRGMANTKPQRFTGNLHIKTDGDFDAMMQDVLATRRPIPSQSGLLRDLLREEWERTRRRNERKRA